MSKKNMLTREMELNLKKQHYAIIGNHSAVKICTWTKKSINNEDFCYKQKFYGIRSHLCCQMTTSICCPNMCEFCWREPLTPYSTKWLWSYDKPEEIIKKAIESQRKLLSGFGGSSKANKKKLKEAQNPKHFALSLIGESIMYPKINQLIKLLHKQGNTTFLVTKGQFPEKLAKLQPVTQLYISLDAPNKKIFNSLNKPLFKDGWERLNKSLEIMKKLRKKTRTTIRITCIKGINMLEEKNYAELIKKSNPLFIEVKAYMWVGSSRLRLQQENMPSHNEVKEFANKIALLINYKVIDEKPNSRVVLLAEKDFKGRIMKF